MSLYQRHVLFEWAYRRVSATNPRRGSPLHWKVYYAALRKVKT